MSRYFDTGTTTTRLIREIASSDVNGADVSFTALIRFGQASGYTAGDHICGTSGWSLRYTGSTTFAFYVNNTKIGGDETVPNDNDFHSLVLTSQTTGSVSNAGYFDDSLIVGKDTGTSRTTGSSDFCIGSDYQSGNFCDETYVAEAAIYTSILTAQNITDLANNTRPSAVGTPALYWDFDQGNQKSIDSTITEHTAADRWLYKLDDTSGNLVDGSGNGLTLTTSGSFSYNTPTPVYTGGALQMNATQYAKRDNYTMPATADLTMWGFMMYDTGGDEDARMMQYGDGQTSSDIHAMMSVNSNNKFRFRLRTDSGGGTTDTLATAGSEVVNTQWMFFAGRYTKSSGEMVLRKNDNQVASKTHSGSGGNIQSTAKNLTLGASVESNDTTIRDYFYGKLDYQCCTSRVLTDDQLNELFYVGIGGLDDDQVGGSYGDALVARDAVGMASGSLVFTRVPPLSAFHPTMNDGSVTHSAAATIGSTATATADLGATAPAAATIGSTATATAGMETTKPAAATLGSTVTATTGLGSTAPAATTMGSTATATADLGVTAAATATIGATVTATAEMGATKSAAATMGATFTATAPLAVPAMEYADVYLVDCGTSDDDILGPANRQWTGDEDHESFSWLVVSPGSTRTGAGSLVGLTGTTANITSALFDEVRYENSGTDEFDWTLTAPGAGTWDGEYKLRFHMALKDGWNTAANQRLFDIKVNDAVVHSSVDVYAAVGDLAVYTLETDLSAPGGTDLVIAIETLASDDNDPGFLSAIEVLESVEVTARATVGSTITATAEMGVTRPAAATLGSTVTATAAMGVTKPASATLGSTVTATAPLGVSGSAEATIGSTFTATADLQAFAGTTHSAAATIGATVTATAPLSIPGSGLAPGSDSPWAATTEPGPVGSALNTFYTRKAIAVWDHVDYEKVTSSGFTLGINAYHGNAQGLSKGGIDYISVGVNTDNVGDWVQVSSPSLNPMTGQYQWCAELDVDSFTNDGIYEFRAIAYPVHGQPRLLPSLWLVIDKNDDWASRNNLEFYVNSSTGNDSTGDGSYGAPYLTIKEAIWSNRRARPTGSEGNDCSGIRVYLQDHGSQVANDAAPYIFGTTHNSSKVLWSQDRWIEIMPEPSYSGDALDDGDGPIISSFGDGMGGGDKVQTDDDQATQEESHLNNHWRIRLKNIKVWGRSGGTKDNVDGGGGGWITSEANLQKYLAEPRWVWFDRCWWDGEATPGDLDGPGRFQEQNKYCIDGNNRLGRVYVTNSKISNVEGGLHSVYMVRGLDVYGLRRDLFYAPSVKATPFGTESGPTYYDPIVGWNISDVTVHSQGNTQSLHADFLQSADEASAHFIENAVFRNIRVLSKTDSWSASTSLQFPVFLDGSTWNSSQEIKDVAFVNIYNTGGTTRLEAVSTDHLLLWGWTNSPERDVESFPLPGNDESLWLPDAVNHPDLMAASGISIRNSVFRGLGLSGIDSSNVRLGTSHDADSGEAKHVLLMRRDDGEYDGVDGLDEATVAYSPLGGGTSNDYTLDRKPVYDDYFTDFEAVDGTQLYPLPGGDVPTTTEHLTLDDAFGSAWPTVSHIGAVAMAPSAAPSATIGSTITATAAMGVTKPASATLGSTVTATAPLTVGAVTHSAAATMGSTATATADLQAQGAGVHSATATMGSTFTAAANLTRQSSASATMGSTFTATANLGLNGSLSASATMGSTFTATGGLTLRSVASGTNQTRQAQAVDYALSVMENAEQVVYTDQDGDEISVKALIEREELGTLSLDYGNALTLSAVVYLPQHLIAKVNKKRDRIEVALEEGGEVVTARVTRVIESGGGWWKVICQR